MTPEERNVNVESNMASNQSMDGGSDKRVLVVDDDAGLRKLILKRLAREGLAAEEASTGAEAIERSAAEPSLLLLLDHQLGDMTGIDVVRSLSGRGVKPFFVMMTGKGDERLAVDMMKLGAADYLVKDMDLIERLPNVLERVFRSIETERRLREAQEALRESEEMSRSMLENAAMGMYLLQDKKFIYVNPNFENIIGYGSQELLGREALGYTHPDDRDTVRTKAVENLKGISSLPYEFRMMRKDGRLIWVMERVAPIRYKGKRAVLASFMDITERKKAEDALVEARNALEHLAMHDPLTGILNRRAILDILLRELPRAKRQGTGLAIGICDIDHFKSINDTYGHPVGDEVLCGLVRIMQSNLRQYDLLGRLGGEEFLVITPGIQEDDVVPLYQRLLSGVAETTLPTKSESLSITISIGVKIWRGEENPDEVLKAADDALYDAKKSGRNRVSIMNDAKA
jgi:diguanylate cyclase (GGDEF)-like protein/PAS domain S-box-containing protein